MSDTREQMTATRSLLEAARRDAERALHRLEKEEAKAKTREEIVAAYEEEKSVKVLAGRFDVTTETVRSALKDAGVYAPTRRGKLSPEKREQIANALKDNPNIADQALAWGVSAATIRSIGQEAGIIKKGPPRTPRTDQQMHDIALVEEKIRDEFGAGFAALDAALKSWRKHFAGPPAEVEETPAEQAAPAPAADGAPWE